MSFTRVPHTFEGLVITLVVFLGLAYIFGPKKWSEPRAPLKRPDWRKQLAPIVAVVGAGAIVGPGLKASIWLLAQIAELDAKPVRWLLLFIWLLAGSAWGIRLYRIVRGWGRPEAIDILLAVISIAALCIVAVLRDAAPS